MGKFLEQKIVLPVRTGSDMVKTNVLKPQSQTVLKDGLLWFLHPKTLSGEQLVKHTLDEFYSAF